MAGGYKLIEAKDGKPFQKNDPRINKAGRPPKLPELDELLAKVLSENISGKETIEWVLRALAKKALRGDTRAAELLMNRSYGLLKNKTDMKLDFTRMSEEDIDAVIERLIIKNDKQKNI